MLSESSEHDTACERLLAYELAELALELRQLDAADLIAWIRGNRLGNIASVIASSCELTFAPATLRFSLSGRADLSWKGPCEVSLDMEFHHEGVDCYFVLLIAEASAGIRILFLSIDGAICRTARCVDRLAAALKSARIDSERRVVGDGRRRKPYANKSS